MLPDLSPLVMLGHHMSYPTFPFSLCFPSIACIVASVGMVPTRGILGYFFAYGLGYRLFRIVPSGIALALARNDDYSLLLRLAHAAYFTVDVFIALIVFVYFCSSLLYILKFSFGCCVLSTIERYSGSGSAGSSSWLSFADFYVNVYLRDYTGNLDAQTFQEMPVHGLNHVAYDAGHGFNREIRVGTWIKRWKHLGGRDAVLREHSAPWLDMPFLRCRVELCYVVCIPETVACYVNVTSNSLPTASLGFVELDKLFD